ncbi:hypothetical protein PVAP13_6NG178500 [Panicum virgatum]|uniref:Uncharacterized protein n=1 Tax=Panicum virgatum TaxID=38727 RepID=A0A8T0QYE4_PANVG|nr:hypothetical protein PVAP13_6NG178500 [Panicum virgatum]
MHMPDASAMQSKVEVLDDEDNTRVLCCCTWNRQWSKGLLPLFWELLTSNLVSEFLSGKNFDYIFVRGVGAIMWFVRCRPAAPLIMSIVIYLNVNYNLWKICDLQQFWGYSAYARLNQCIHTVDEHLLQTFHLAIENWCALVECVGYKSLNIFPFLGSLYRW